MGVAEGRDCGFRERQEVGGSTQEHRPLIFQDGVIFILFRGM